MPQFVPEGTQFDQGLQAGPTASLGIGSLNLRGIGPNRTLVLVDGRRAQPANAALIVDINTIPSAAIERVETITGGASAVYGADAMAGVVNFILKDDFEGVEMDFQTGATQEGDGEETRFTSLLGVNSGDGDGNVMLGVEWYHRGERFAQVDRDFFRNGWFDPGSNAGGFLQAPAYSPNTTNQPFGDGRAADAGRRRPDFRGHARLLSLRGCGELRGLHAGCGSVQGSEFIRDLFQPRRLAVRPGRCARLQLGFRHGVQ